jgi:FKBP-type peptidyl-prolyl cis-trans isomerase
MKEMQEKRVEEAKKQQAKELEDLKKSGELDKQEKEILDYLAKKRITTAKKTGGTYVDVKEKGTGEPAVTGKFITVKYVGRGLATDSVFQTGEYIFPLGNREVIEGWDQGIGEFNKGGKGTLYVPGYLAYGTNPGPTGKPYAALIFEIEIANVSDTREKAENDKRVADSIATKSGKKVN